MRKIIAKTLGRKLPYFKGKNKIIRILYSPDRNLNSGEKFITDYFEKKYEGITSNFIDWGVYFCGGLEKGLVNYIKTEISQFSYFLDIGGNSGTISLPFCDRKDLKIICFEPLEYSYKKLIRNYEINNLRNKKDKYLLSYSGYASNRQLCNEKAKVKASKEDRKLCRSKNRRIEFYFTVNTPDIKNLKEHNNEWYCI